MALAPTGLNAAGAGDPLRRMHVTRPKSAKGRTRTIPQSFSHNVEEAYPICTSPSPRVSSVRSLPSPRLEQDDIQEILNQIPCRPPSSSLNRYRVLPSIGASGGGNCTDRDLVTKTSSMKLSPGLHERQTKSLYRDQSQPAASRGETGTGQRPARTEDAPLPAKLKEPSDQEPRLLLAIRCHCGKRFEQYFRRSDTLHSILAAAEEKTGVPCKDCSVETMEVPRRRFPDLSQTLQQCGIPNKSVLCIHQVERD
ncbi:UBX domain-containing protein 10 [Pseudophryne corroboree]|uniref:UBX domain-containing protein 10 n=1 Tax=Pseudophryne corroboree TaxID=495146 RepID=UPI003081FB18